MKLNLRLSAFPVSRFAARLIELEATARAALLGRLEGSRGDRAATVAAPDDPTALSQPADRSP